MWGEIKPTKPIVPEKATLVPTKNDTANMIIFLLFFTSTPMLLANDSLIDRASSSLLLDISMIENIKKY